jgi:hypothetical protein
VDGLERDEGGTPTGRLLQLDEWLRSRLPPRPGASRLRADLGAYAVTLGPRKVILDDATLPDAPQLGAMISQAHRSGSAVAVHCVTGEQLIVTVAAMERAGVAGDWIEHASVVPPGYPAALARLGPTVVVQPGFISDRGDDYRREVEAAELAWPYPCASLIRAGVAVAGSTDAPFGPADPWRCIAAAAQRRTPGGTVLGRSERISGRPGARAQRTENRAPTGTDTPVMKATWCVVIDRLVHASTAGFICSAQPCRIFRAVSGPPVKVTFFAWGWATRAAPASGAASEISGPFQVMITR